MSQFNVQELDSGRICLVVSRRLLCVIRVRGGGGFGPSTTSPLPTLCGGGGKSFCDFPKQYYFPPLQKGVVVVPFLCLLQCALVKIFTHVKESFRSSFYPCPLFLTTLWVGRCTILGSSREINDLSLDPGKRAGKQRKPFPLRLFFVSTQHFRYWMFIFKNLFCA